MRTFLEGLLIALPACLFMLWAEWRNRARRYCWWALLLGTCSNMLVFACNHFRMPVTNWPPVNDGIHVNATSNSHLIFLADVYGLGDQLRYSIGDGLLVVGFLALCYVYVTTTKKEK